MLQRQTEPPTSQAPNHSTDLSVARQSARLSAQVKSSVEGMSQIPIKTGVDRQEEDVTLPCTAKKQETITFPPLALRCRKFIHELANQFGVKSKSVGGTDQRCPSLSRTAKTLPYAESRFEQALAHLRRDYCSYIQKTQVGQWRKPELNNPENRGRVMLEKMGWSNGTALGAADNKGILQPVTHTMRRNKIGLQ
ncbi:Protein SQS1 [Ophiocordyceps camponoti-floridani]|uniref:Protein SQS1 n=1 Tax=Ophiocordyceps camponoti-floridani TaxID=2030778 RepID=A0A8H4Q7R1_9HYPO|nr:Protein SQS1 [Ophiocordyceps camponoti-floridani]